MHEVADAVQTAHALDAQIASATQARDAAQKAYDVATARYDAGLGTQLDVLSAQRPLLLFDQQLVALRAQRLGAMVDLQRALGGGLEIAHPIALAAANASSPSTESRDTKAPTP